MSLMRNIRGVVNEYWEDNSLIRLRFYRKEHARLADMVEKKGFDGNGIGHDNQEYLRVFSEIGIAIKNTPDLYGVYTLLDEGWR